MFSELDNLQQKPGLTSKGFPKAVGLENQKAENISVKSTSLVRPGLSQSADFPPLAAPSKISVPQSDNASLQKPEISNSQPIKPVIPMTPSVSSRPEPPAKSEEITKVDKNTVENEPVELQDQATGHQDTSIEERESSIQLSKGDSKTHEHVDTYAKGKDTPRQPTGKRQRPSKLNIATAKEMEKDVKSSTETSEPSKSMEPTKETHTGTINSISQADTPTTVQSQSPASAVSRQPRTLRLVSTIKTEVSPTLPAASNEVRKSSIAMAENKPAPLDTALSSMKQSGTPVQEVMSDVASVTSVSISRPPTPSSSKPGSTSTRPRTKNQAKKERQARAKKAEDSKTLDETSSPAQEEVVQEPILGRKKKTKRPKESTPISTDRDDDQLPRKGTKSSKEEVAPSEDEARLSGDARISKEPAQLNNKSEGRSQDIVDPTLAKVADPAGKDQGVGSPSTPASLFAELHKSGIIDPNVMDMFLNIPGLNYRYETGSTKGQSNQNPPLSDEDISKLDHGEAICVMTNEQEGAVILPDRSVLRHLTHEEGKRYLESRKSLLQSDEQFSSAQHFPVESWMHIGSDDFYGAIGPSKAGSDDAEDLLPQPEELGKIFGSVIMRPGAGPDHGTLYSQRRHPANEGLAARIANMSVDETEIALRGSEEACLAAKKETEAIEKKLNPLLKRNRKMLRDWCS